MLTFGIWSSPEPGPLVSNDSLVNEVDLGGVKETKASVIAPTEVIFHGGNTYYGFTHPTDKQSLYQRMNNWELTGFETEESTSAPDNTYMVELIFPDEIPMELVGSLFNLSEEVTLPSWSFRQVYITFLPESASLQVHFQSIDGREETTAYVNNSEEYEFLWAYLNELDPNVLEPYLALEQTANPVYIREGEVQLPSSSITFNNIDPELLVNVLFTNPSVVSQSISPGIGERYFTDGQRGLRVFRDGSRMEYVNPYSEDSTSLSPVNLLNESIYHINGHNGWTEDYYLTDINPEQYSIGYRMHYQGYPVFNRSNLATIEQVWGSEQLVEYHRPLFKLRDSLSEVMVELPSGRAVLDYLASNSQDYQLDNIEDIQVGYRLNYQGSSQYIEMEPTWYMKYNGRWRSLSIDDSSATEGGN